MLAEDIIEDLYPHENDEIYPRLGDTKELYCQAEKRYIQFEYCEQGYWIEI